MKRHQPIGVAVTQFMTNTSHRAQLGKPDNAIGEPIGIADRRRGFVLVEAVSFASWSIGRISCQAYMPWHDITTPASRRGLCVEIAVIIAATVITTCARLKSSISSQPQPAPYGKNNASDTDDMRRAILPETESVAPDQSRLTKLLYWSTLSSRNEAAARRWKLPRRYVAEFHRGIALSCLRFNCRKRSAREHHSGIIWNRGRMITTL